MASSSDLPGAAAGADAARCKLMDTTRAPPPPPRHLHGADDDVASWVAGNQFAWDLLSRPQAPYTSRPRQGSDDGGSDPDPFVTLREFLDRMPAATPWQQQAQADADVAAQQLPNNAVATTDAGAVHDDAYRIGGFGAVPASSEAIAALRETSAGEAREPWCTVCMQGFEPGDKLRRMPCTHSYHEGCIFDWLRVSRICPLCRHRLPAEKQ